MLIFTEAPKKTCNIQKSNYNFPDWFWFWTKPHPTQGHGVVQRSSTISHRIIYTLFIYERTEYFDLDKLVPPAPADLPVSFRLRSWRVIRLDGYLPAACPGLATDK